MKNRVRVQLVHKPLNKLTTSIICDKAKPKVTFNACDAFLDGRILLSYVLVKSRTSRSSFSSASASNTKTK